MQVYIKIISKNSTNENSIRQTYCLLDDMQNFSEVSHPSLATILVK